MKIGILTFHRPSNFGANLQAYSSCIFFKSLGHEVKVIDYVRQNDLEYCNSVNSRQFSAHKDFVETMIPLTIQAETVDVLKEICKDECFDVIVIGADAVWRSPSDGGVYFANWLFNDTELASKTKVTSMSAAHMGNGFTNLNEVDKLAIKNSLKLFSYISVRDVWTRDKINQDIFGGEEYVTAVSADPVFMLSNYVDNIKWESNGIKSKKYIIMSLPKNWLESNRKYKLFRKIWFKRFKKLVNQAGLQLIELPIPEGKSGLEFDYCVDYPINPIQWFLWIKNAKGFVGLRFHAIVSCISNGTPFYSIDSYGAYSQSISFLDYIGCHKKARSKDKNSKIRNLLIDTPFEQNRTGINPETESPRKILSLLLECSKSSLNDLKVKYQNEFTMNIKNLLNSVK